MTLPKPAHPVTAMEVAEIAGVSRSAVSRTFTAGASVAPETRRKVLAVAERLGYRPNVLARMLTSRRRMIVAIVMGTLTNPFRSQVLESLSDRIHADGLLPVLFRVMPGESIDDVLSRVRQYQVVAIIVTGHTPSRNAVQASLRDGAPVIVLNRGVDETIPAIFISTDHFELGVLAARILLRAGYRKPGFVAGDRDQPTSKDRERGFLTELRKAGIRKVPVVEGRFTYEGGYAAAQDMLGRASPPDAVLCANDMSALGFIDAARQEFGIAPPHDIGVLGIDGIPEGRRPAYRLDTIAQQIDVLVDKVAAAIGEILSTGQCRQRVTLIPGQVVGGSTLPVPPA